jgi:hypothetical protein
VEIVPGHPGTPSLSRAIPHVFPIVQALKHPSTQAPAPRHPQASLSFSGSLACTNIFIPSLPFTALSRAGVNFTSLSPLLTTPYAPSNSPFHSSSQIFFNAPTPGQQLLLLDFALALGISLSIHPTAARPASVHSTLIPHRVRSQTLYHTFNSL